MKINITMKSPDSVYEAVRYSVKNEINKIKGINNDEREELEESRMEDTFEKLSKWIEYQEYVYLEFDTEEGTAKILEA